jgi:phage-related tail fiber protein
MSATKASAAFTWASGSATTSGTTNAISTSTHYADAIYVKVVVVGTPTSSFTFQIAQSPDGSTYYPGQSFAAPLVAGSYYFGPPQTSLDPTCESVELIYVAQSGGTSSTLTAQIGELTAL